MTRVISPRYVSQAVLAATCGLLLFATAARAETKTWNLASDFPLTKLNPAPDKYGHKVVWAYTYSNVKKPGAYAKLTEFYGAAAEEAECGVKEFYSWNKAKFGLAEPPAIFYNAGETVEPGTINRCDTFATYPSKTVFLHPQLSPPGAAAAVRWKAMMTGTLTVSGSVECVDPRITGISWELDRGSTVLLGPTETFADNPMPFGPTAVSVVKGESLYLRVGPAKGASGASDSTAVGLTITSP